jgi:nickel-dependent lactate racemase
MSRSGWNRRELLIGTALAPGTGLAQRVGALKGAAKSVVIPTHEFAGDIDERLDFPAAWEVNVMKMRGHDAPVLTPEQIRQQLDKPVGTRPLREIAAGKKTVVITFDDLTRTTPTYEVTPWVIGELKAAGIADEDIVFLSSFGTHRCMTALEVQKKLGKEIARRFAWVNHDVFSNHKDVGETSFKNRVKLNNTFMAADLKICLSGIKIHQDAGYGGGAKAVLPGVAGLDSIEYNHVAILRNIRTAGPVRVFKNEMRLDMIEAARMAKVDFSVQIMYNSKLRPTHVFSGDIIEAHHAAVRVAAGHYATPTFENADIVVTSGYPQNAQAYHSQRWIGRSVREGGTGVLIIQHPLGLDPVHYLNQRLGGRTVASYFEQTARRRNAPLPKNSGLIVYSQYMDRQQMNTFPRATAFASTWEQVIRLLQERHQGEARVAVYPYGGMQHQEIELDG